jgi:hypothetical protein
MLGYCMGIILMLSSVSAPSRVPQVVCKRALSARSGNGNSAERGATYLCDSNAAVQLDEIVKVPEQDRDGHKANIARIS